MEIKPWTIYLWRRGNAIEGASPVVTRDGIKQVYCHGWDIEPEPERKRNEEKHQEWRAKVKVKNLLNNTLNVLNWYGKKVLDSKGDIDEEKLKEIEARGALQAYKQSQKTKQTIGLDDLYPIKKFPVKEITASEAFEYEFIGSKLQFRTQDI